MCMVGELTGLGCLRSGYAKLFGAVTSQNASAGLLRLAKRSRAYTAPEGGSPRSASPGCPEPSLHSDSEAKHEVCTGSPSLEHAPQPPLDACIPCIADGARQQRGICRHACVGYAARDYRLFSGPCR